MKTAWNKGIKLSEEHKRKIRQWSINNPEKSKYWSGKKRSEETKIKMSLSAKRGKEHHRFKHGLTGTNLLKSFLERRRNLNKLGNGGTHSILEWNDLKKKFNFMCLCCKCFEPEIKLTEDHIVPISLGGDNSIENIQPLCQSCNSLKWTKIIDYRILI